LAVLIVDVILLQNGCDFQKSGQALVVCFNERSASDFFPHCGEWQQS
jgi:hypothetical protein